MSDTEKVYVVWKTNVRTRQTYITGVYRSVESARQAMIEAQNDTNMYGKSFSADYECFEVEG